jgi:hypothetical protein
MNLQKAKTSYKNETKGVNHNSQGIKLVGLSLSDLANSQSCNKKQVSNFSNQIKASLHPKIQIATLVQPKNI